MRLWKDASVFTVVYFIHSTPPYVSSRLGVGGGGGGSLFSKQGYKKKDADNILTRAGHTNYTAWRCYMGHKQKKKKNPTATYTHKML